MPQNTALTPELGTHSRWLLAPLAISALMLTSACDDGETTEDAQNGEAAEGDTADEDTAEDAPADGEDAEGDSADEGAADEGAEDLTMAAVEENDSEESCWVVIEDTVYDVTEWIGDHPGGPEAIEGLCGTDGTEDFLEQHEGSDDPEEALAGFELGPLED